MNVRIGCQTTINLLRTLTIVYLSIRLFECLAVYIFVLIVFSKLLLVFIFQKSILYSPPRVATWDIS